MYSRGVNGGIVDGPWRAVVAAAVAAASLLLLLAPGAAAQAPAIEIGVPTPTGRFEVGTRALEFVDRSRLDTPGSPGPRRLMVQATYPLAAERGGTCKPSAYISPLVQPILVEAVGVDRGVDIDTAICRGGRLAPGERPVLIFSHAYTADRFVYASLVNDLASRGYVVLAPDHPPDAFAVEYPGGQLVVGEYGRPLSPAEITGEQIAALNELRAADVRFVLTKAVKLAKRRSGLLAGHLDPGRVGVLGHSLGGSTAARAAQLDRRFDAVVDLDGSLFGDWAATVGSETPFMLLAAEGGVGETFAAQPLCGYVAGLRGPRFAFELAGALHFSYSDFQSLAPRLAAAYPEWVFAGLYQTVVGTIDPEASILAQRRALAAFFARYVKGKAGAAKPRPVDGFSELPIGGCAS
jgi:dienelactone hydrolase